MEEYIPPLMFYGFLNEQTGERSMSEFLKERPEILYWTFCRPGGHTRFVFREFPIGSRYIADFVVVNSHSSAWKVKFIELEPIDDPVFTKAGTPSKRLSQALKQVDDWAEYYDAHKGQIRADLVEWAKNKDLLKYNDGNNPSNYAGDYLADPQTRLIESFHIIIGRREKMSSHNNRRKGTYSSKHGIEIISYDRFLDLVNDRYANSAYWLNKR